MRSRRGRTSWPRSHPPKRSAPKRRSRGDRGCARRLGRLRFHGADGVRPGYRGPRDRPGRRAPRGRRGPAGGRRRAASSPADMGESSSSTTDDDGRFRIEARAGRHDLTVGADRYAPFEQSVDLIPNRDTDVGEVQLAPGVRSSGAYRWSRGRCRERMRDHGGGGSHLDGSRPITARPPPAAAGGRRSASSAARSAWIAGLPRGRVRGCRRGPGR